MWELAGNGDLKAIEALLPKGERIEAQDAARGTKRIAIVANGRLAGSLFVTETGELPPRDWLNLHTDLTGSDTDANLG